MARDTVPIIYEILESWKFSADLTCGGKESDVTQLLKHLSCIDFGSITGIRRGGNEKKRKK